MKYTVWWTGERGNSLFGGVSEEKKDELVAAHPHAKVLALVKPEWQEKVFTVFPPMQDNPLPGQVRKPWKVVCKPVYCDRCGGSGEYGPYHIWEGTCFKCQGTGFKHLRMAE